MAPYWFFFISFAFLSISPINLEKNLKKTFKYSLLFLLIIFIGFRHEVGGDWDIYLYDLEKNITSFNIIELNYVRDFGYELISYIMYNLKFNIYGTNLLLAIFFVYSLNKFANEFKENYWLIFLIAFPYLITVVAMGFTRQATALAFVLISISELKNKKLINYIFYSLIALLFHKSSFILIPIVFLTHVKFSYKNIFIFLILFLISFVLIYPEINRITSGYLSENSKYVSKGVYYRIFLNILAGIIFLIFFNKLKTNDNIDKLIILIFFINVALLFIINQYSTLVDRLIIYYTFIQLIVFSRFYLVNPKYKIFFNLCVIFTYSILFAIWLYFSNHSYAWIPYNNLIFESLK